MSEIKNQSEVQINVNTIKDVFAGEGYEHLEQSEINKYNGLVLEILDTYLQDENAKEVDLATIPNRNVENVQIWTKLATKEKIIDFKQALASELRQVRVDYLEKVKSCL